MVRGKGSSVLAPGTEEFKKDVIARDAKKMLSSSEIAQLNDEKKELQNILQEAGDKDRATNVDIYAIQNRIKLIENQLTARETPEVSGSMKDKLIREEKDIEDKLIVGMPSRREMAMPHKFPQAVRKHMAWDARNDKLIRRYVEIQNILRPEEPKSIEELRKDE
jgi:hypothetical protein